MASWLGRPPVEYRPYLMGAMPRRTEKQELARTDRRWLVTAAAVFLASLGVAFGAVEVYRATGPHPQVATFLRHAKYYANALLRHRFRRP